MKNKNTIFSSCRKYRYVLWREWDKNNPKYAMFIGLNPSTADETLDDPTIRRCIQFSKDWGYGSLCMTNIFAFRTPEPKIMKLESAPIGEDNDKYLLEYSKDAAIVIACWGNDGKYLNRGEYIKKLIPNLYCLKLSKNGNPWHPLYLKKDLKPFIYE